MYSADRGFPIFEQTYWWGDAWDGREHGREFDFSRTFFEQFAELAAVVPRISLVNTNSENSYYTSHGLNLKNCYGIVGGVDSEDCLHSFFVQNCRDVVDTTSLVDCELCIAGHSSLGCYDCAYVAHCRNCVDSLLIRDCTACRDCIGCVGLEHRQYCVLNQQYSREEYEKLKSEIWTGRRSDLENFRKKFEALQKTLPLVTSHQYHCEDCTGDMLFHCRACEYCFDCRECERCKFVMFTPNGVESYDSTFTAPAGVQFGYENVSTLGNNMIGNALVWYGADTEYSTECHSSHDLFGCIGLKRAEYCILNRQYSREEYFALRERIVAHMKSTGEWGEFFPLELAPFAYEDSAADEFFPRESAGTAVARCAATVLDDLAAIGDAACREVHSCGCGKKFHIQKSELRIHKKMNVPLAGTCPDCRRAERNQWRSPRSVA